MGLFVSNKENSDNLYSKISPNISFEVVFDAL